MDQQTALIIADDVNFSRTLISAWQAERPAPAFVHSETEFFARTSALQPTYDLVIIGPMPAGHLDSLLSAPQAAAQPVVCVVPQDDPIQLMRARHPRATFVRETEGWADVAVLVSTAIMDRMEAVVRACRAERAVASSERYAILGRYALDMRHNFNNALTSVLGNAELMLLEPGTLPSDVWEQVQTIHGMALRMHEIMQRLTSLETEMSLAQEETLNETPHAAHSFVA